MASVKIEGLTHVQANAIAILFENGKIIDFINDDLEKIRLEEHAIDADSCSVEFDECEDPDHEVSFDW